MKQTAIYLISLLTTSLLGLAQTPPIEYEENKVVFRVNDEFRNLNYSVEELNAQRVFSELISSYSISTVESVFRSNDTDLKGYFWLEHESGQTLQLVRDLSGVSWVEIVERIPVYKTSFTPSDLVSQNWGLKKINAEKAWDYVKGSKNIVVAVVDDAVQIDHEDLIDNVWKNSGEIPGNGIDDDGNGYKDDDEGWDSYYQIGDPRPNNTARAAGKQTHGTHVSSIAAARTNNGKGMASVSFNVSLMPIKTSYIDSSGNVALDGVALARGIRYATVNNADIINMSWGGYGKSSIIQAAISSAHKKDILLVAAAGNGGRTSYGSFYLYPASYANVLSVGASDQSDKKTNFSQYNDSIDVLAPGHQIYGCLARTNTSYGALSGTSMASPMVAGMAALILSKNPNLTALEVQSIIKTTALNVDALNSSFVGKIGTGRIDIEKAILNTPGILANFDADWPQVCPSASVSFKNLSIGTGYTSKWTFTGGSPSSSTSSNPKVTYSTTGWYDVQLIVSNSYGADTVLKKKFIEVVKPSAELVSQTEYIMKGRAAILRVNLEGKPPLSFGYTDGTNYDTVTNIQSKVYYVTVRPDSTKTYSLTFVRDADCAGDTSGQKKVIVNTNFVQDLSKCTSFKYSQKVSDTQGKFTANFSGSDRFGYSMCNIGDWNGDGNEDVAVGAHKHTNSTSNGGAIFLLFLDSNQTVKSYQEIGENTGGFNQSLGPQDHFGTAVSLIGDLDNDGVPDLAVGASHDDDGGTDKGAVYILFMKADGTVKSHAKISSSVGTVTGLGTQANFGITVRSMGDFNSDGIPDIAVGAYGQNGKRGAIYTLALNRNGTVKSQKTIGSGSAGFTSLDASDYFGAAIELVADLDNNGVPEILVGAHSDDDGYSDAGAFYLLFLKSDGTCRKTIKFSNNSPGLKNIITQTSRFGKSLSVLKSDQDRLRIFVGANAYDSWKGSVWQIDVDTFGNVFNLYRMDSDHQTLKGKLDNSDQAGYSIATIADKNKNYHLGIGTSLDDDGGTDRGALHILSFFDSTCFKNRTCTKYEYVQKISDTAGSFTATFTGADRFGGDCVEIGDWNGDGYQDVIVGAHGHANSGSNTGAIFMLFLDSNQKVKAYQEIGENVGGFSGSLDAVDGFGSAVTTIGDLNQDGVDDLAVCAFQDDDGSTDAGAVYILFMKSDGTVKSYKKISSTTGSITGLGAKSTLGTAITDIGDYNGDGTHDIAIGAYRHQSARGAVFILGLNKDGTVKSQKTLSSGSNGMPTLDTDDFLGIEVESLGDLDGNGINDLLVGAYYDDDGNSNSGAIYMLLLKPDGSVRKWVKFSNSTWTLNNRLASSILFGASTKHIYTLNGMSRIIIGSTGSSSGQGSIWQMDLDTFGNVYNPIELSSGHRALSGKLSSSGRFGSSLAYFENSTTEKYLMIGSSLGNDGTGANGTVHILQVSDTCMPDTSPCEIKANWLAAQNCLNEGSEFINITNAQNDINVVNVTWEMGDSTFYTGTDTVLHFYSDSGEYKVRLIVSARNTKSGFACYDTLERSISIRDSLLYNLTLRDSICLNDTLVLSLGNITCGKSPFLYEWSPNQYITDRFTDSARVSPPSSMWYYLKLASASTAEVLDSTYVFVDQTCCVNQAKIGIPKVEYCQNDTVALSNLSTADNATASYDWHFGALANITTYSGQTPPKLVMKGAGYDTIRLIVRDKCGNDTAQVVIWVNPTPEMNRFTDTAVCIGDTVWFNTHSDDFFDHYSWSPKGKLFDTLTSKPGYAAISDQRFIFTLTDGITQCSSSDTVDINIKNYPFLDLGKDTTLCNGDSLILRATTADTDNRWNDGSRDSLLVVKQAGTFWLESDLNQCISSDTIDVAFKPTPSVNLGKDTFFCYGDSITLNAFYSGASYVWSDLSTAPTLSIKTGGKYSVVLDLNGCTAVDSIQIDEQANLRVDLGQDTALCDGENLVLMANILESQYRWNDGSTDSVLTVAKEGTFWLEINKNGCTGSDSVVVRIQPNPMVDLGVDTFLCSGDSILLDALYAGAAYVWNDLGTSATHVATTGGVYWVTLDLNGCKASDSIEIDERSTPIVNLGSDTAICDNESLTLFATSPVASYEWQDNSNADSFLVTGKGTYWVLVNANGCRHSDTVNVSENSTPPQLLGSDLHLCDSVRSTIGPSSTLGHTYEWNTGQATSQIAIYTPGEYWLKTTENNCSSYDTITVNLNFTPFFSLGEDTTLCDGEFITLDQSQINAAGYFWQNGSINNLFTTSTSGKYWLTAENNNCRWTDSINVNFERCDCHIFFPTSFSPTGDGLNDTYKPKINCAVKNLHFIIYNRWGVVVFSTEDQNEAWDGHYKGEVAMQGVYAVEYFYTFLENGVSRRKYSTSKVLLIQKFDD